MEVIKELKLNSQNQYLITLTKKEVVKLKSKEGEYLKITKPEIN